MGRWTTQSLVVPKSEWGLGWQFLWTAISTGVLWTWTEVYWSDSTRKLMKSTRPVVLQEPRSSVACWMVGVWSQDFIRCLGVGRLMKWAALQHMSLGCHWRDPDPEQLRNPRWIKMHQKNQQVLSPSPLHPGWPDISEWQRRRRSRDILPSVRSTWTCWHRSEFYWIYVTHRFSLTQPYS